MTAKVTPTDTDAAAARDDDDESAQSPAAPKHTQSMLRPQSEPIPDGATAKLKEAKRAGHTVRMRISATSGGVGAVLGLFMVFSVIAFEPASDLAYAGVMCGPFAAFGLLLAVLPTDHKAIYRVTKFALFLDTILMYGAASFAVYFTPGNEGGDTCLEEAARWYCESEATGSWLQFTVVLVNFTGIVSALRLHPRAALERLWRVIAFMVLGTASVRLYFRVMILIAGSEAPTTYGRTGATIWAWLYVSELLVFGVLASIPSFRSRAQAALMARGGQISSAAGVAALLGDHKIEEIKAVAKQKFFGVDISKINLAHIQRSTPDPELFQLAERAQFYQVDWFVSHSWRDNANAKFQALQNARSRFNEAHRREPIVWLDKFCIDQKNIEENLMCLPIFLAGCKQLYIVCGPTYLERLWCMLEVFVWIEMGGKVDDVELFFIPPETGLDLSNPSAVQDYFEERFASFDVSDASCYDPVQRDRLLSIVEAGFGGLDGFNNALRTTMTQLRAKATLSLVERRSSSVFYSSAVKPSSESASAQPPTEVVVIPPAK